MASSISSPRNCVYDVFPSFRGEDVRISFLSHFLKELDRKLIKSFKDNKIERSQSLDPELKLAIRTSRIVVVVFSDNYTSSSWCLNELLEIVKCKKETGQIVIPVFYRLDPSHVRKQTGKFGDAFAKTCQNQTEAEKQLWQQALTDVANLLGYHSQNWNNEAKMIEEIANDVLKKLLVTTSKDYDEFVGIENHIAEMSVLLNLESEEVRMVGVWGSSGIGKTTIARALYSRISHWFQGTVFIDKAFIYKSMKIYDSSNPDDYNMKLHLQRIFLSKILDQKEIQIDRLGAVEDRLKHQKVLIFIDDLNDQVVLNALVGQIHWFGSGSRIIVITKDKHFLRAHGIVHIYEVCLPSEELALEMFCRSAFRQNSPPDGFMELATEVASRAGNLPLGLNVLGSYLRGRDKEDWVDLLPSLRETLSGQIEKTLRVSYDGLKNKKDKAIFRHIACLFNGAEIEDIKHLLDSNLNTTSGLKNLVDKSLIHVEEDIVKMHSLLQEMGKEIVSGQSDEPGEREFIVDSMDICDVLNDNTGTKKVLGISLDINEASDLYIHESAFKGMRNLRFLKFNTKKWNMKNDVRWNLPESFSYLPSTLRLLSLDEYPLRCMPSNFRPQNLVKLKMRDSKLEKLWEGVNSLTGLKKMDLQSSKNLKELPDLSMAINLEKLHLNDCSSLVEIPSSIQNLNKLKELDMMFCKKLETLPTGINLQSLNRLNCFSCPSLRTFPALSTNISELHMAETAIEEFPSNLLLLKNLVNLNMCAIKSPKLWENIQPLTPIMTMISPSLTRLWLSDIPSLVELPSSFQYLNKLNDLRITGCINLETLPTGINLESLFQVNLSGCLGLKSFPNISTNISHLNLSQTGIIEVPWWIENFSYLMVLGMDGCNNLHRVSQHINKLKHLEKVDISKCGALTSASWNDSSIELATENIQPMLPVPNEASSSLPDKFFPEVEFSLICFNLDPESLLHNRSIIFKSMMLSGEEVPSYFTHRTTGTSSSLTIPLLHSSLSQPFLRIRVCAVVDFDSMSMLAGNGVDIHVNYHFEGRFGDNFESFGQPHKFWTQHRMDSHLFILESIIPLNKDNAPVALLNYDHVDIQIHISRISNSKFRLIEWGVQIPEEFSISGEPTW